MDIQTDIAFCSACGALLPNIPERGQFVICFACKFGTPIDSFSSKETHYSVTLSSKFWCFLSISSCLPIFNFSFLFIYFFGAKIHISSVLNINIKNIKKFKLVSKWFFPFFQSVVLRYIQKRRSAPSMTEAYQRLRTSTTIQPLGPPPPSKYSRFWPLYLKSYYSPKVQKTQDRFATLLLI